MSTMGKTVLLVIVGAVMLTGCRTTVEIDPITGQEKEVKTFDPCFVENVDTGFEIAGTAADVVGPYVPPGYRWLYELLVAGGGGLLLLWQKIRTGKIVRGAKATATAIDRLKKKDSTKFSDVSVGLHAAEDAGATMPHTL